MNHNQSPLFRLRPSAPQSVWIKIIIAVRQKEIKQLHSIANDQTKTHQHGSSAEQLGGETYSDFLLKYPAIYNKSAFVLHENEKVQEDRVRENTGLLMKHQLDV